MNRRSTTGTLNVRTLPANGTARWYRTAVTPAVSVDSKWEGSKPQSSKNPMVSAVSNIHIFSDSSCRIDQV